MLCVKGAGTLRSAIYGCIGRRQLHCSSALFKKVVKDLRFPYMKDKSPIIQRFHKDKSLPFNTLRDVLNFPVISPESLEGTSFAWMEYIAIGEEQSLLEQVEQEDMNGFWLKSIRIAISDDTILKNMIPVLKRKNLIDSSKISIPVEETLVASLLYAGKFDHAFLVFKVLLSKKIDLDWRPILNVCLSLENSDPLRVLENMYRHHGGSMYTTIISHLQDLKVKETYIHTWNNRLVSIGDFPKQSSKPMNKVFKTMLETSNTRSLEHCLKSIAGQVKTPPSWLDFESSKYISQYIIESKDQTSTLQSVVDLFGPATFRKPFWITLYYRTNVNTNLLKTMILKAGLTSNDQQFIEAHCSRLIKEGPDKFWAFANSTVEEYNSPLLSLQILTMYVEQSQDLNKAYDFAIHLLSQYTNYTEKIIKTFVLGCTARLEGTYNSNKILLQFQDYLTKRGMMSDRAQNLFIYSDLKLSYIRSAIQRIEKMLANPDSVIDKGTLDHCYKILSSNRHLRNLPVQDGESPVHYLLKLSLRMHKHCDEVSKLAWNSLLKKVATSFDITDTENFCKEVIDHVNRKSDLNFSSSNIKHPLRQIFDKRLIAKIILQGFKDPDAPWNGVALLSRLQSNGVYVPKNLVKKHVVELLKDNGLPNSEKKLYGHRKPLTNANVSLELILDKINEIEHLSV